MKMEMFVVFKLRKWNLEKWMNLEEQAAMK